MFESPAFRHLSKESGGPTQSGASQIELTPSGKRRHRVTIIGSLGYLPERIKGLTWKVSKEKCLHRFESCSNRHVIVTIEWKDLRYVVYVDGVEHSRWKNPTPANAILFVGPEWYQGEELRRLLERDEEYPNNG